MPVGIYKHPPQCGFQKGHHINKGIKRSKETRKKMSIAKLGQPATSGAFKKGHKPYPQIGKKHWNWKGGKRDDGRGYILIYNPNHPFANKKGYVLEHRLVIEKFLGRYLTSIEKCHHLGKKDDNKPHMLMAFVNCSAHTKFEWNGKVRLSDIVFDGRKLKKIGGDDICVIGVSSKRYQ